MQLEWNDLHQPIGDNALHFSQILGSIVRNSGHASLQVRKWANIFEEAKEMMWSDVVENVDITDDKKKWVFQSMGKRFKEWRNDLKKNYNARTTNEERLRNKPKDITDLDWEWLIQYWSSPEVQAAATWNSQNRAKQVIKHAGETNCFARYKDEEERSKEDGTTPSRVDMFIKTHKRKDGLPSDPVSAEIIDKFEKHRQSAASSSTPIDDDIIYTAVMGPERHSRMRGMGLGPTPSSYYGRGASSSILELNDMREKMAQMEAQRA